MKKLICLICSIIVCVSALFMPTVKVASASGAFEASPSLVSEIKTELTNLITDSRIVRPAGSDGEKETLDYILASLSSVSGLEALNNAYFDGGKQTVNFENSEGFAKTTYNVGIRLPSSTANAKTLSIITNVDNLPMVLYAQNANGETEKLYTYSEAVNESAGSVALMMALAKYLAESSLTFDFNINFIFCGAGGENNAGAYAYKRSIASDIAKNQVVLCLNKVTVGDYNYFYTQDYSASYADYIKDYFNEGLGFKTYNKTTAIKTNTADVTSAQFVHAGIEGAAGAFYNTEFNLISVFSGSYNGFSSLGNSESQNHSQITNTALDTTNYIELEYKRNVALNLGYITSATISLISSAGFSENAFQPHNNMAKIALANNKILAFSLTGFAVVLMFVIYYFVYSNMLKKSKMQMNSEELNDIIINVKNENDKQEDKSNKEE